MSLNSKYFRTVTNFFFAWLKQNVNHVKKTLKKLKFKSKYVENPSIFMYKYTSNI